MEKRKHMMIRYETHTKKREYWSICRPYACQYAALRRFSMLLAPR